MPRPNVLLDHLVDRVERASALDPVAAKVAAVAQKLGPGRIKDALAGTAAGHPVHPVLVTVPLGAWVTASMLDGRGMNNVAARRSVGFGVLAALPAVTTGLSDWAETSGAEQRVGLVHAAVNDTGIALYAVSWLVRRRGRPRTRGGPGGGGTRRRLGRRLARRSPLVRAGRRRRHHRLPAYPDDWRDVGALTDLPEGAPAEVDVDGVPLVAVRRGTTVDVLADRCTHRGAPLHEGPIVDGCIECPWHGSRFDLSDGSVVRGPATRPQAVMEARVRDGRVEVRRADEPRSLRTNPVGV